MTGELRVAPTDVASERNVVREPLRVVDSWRVEDAHFAFDSSAILPSMAGDLARLRKMLLAYPEHPITIFGHADTTGNDDYNKRLSGRRAVALYALLTRRPDLWDTLYTTALGRDDWKKLNVVDGVFRPHLATEGKSLPAGTPRSAVFSAYMDLVCRDDAGRGFGLSARRFLGQGADPGGKADYQGCSEFNPIVMFSSEEQKRYALAADKTERDREGAPNRRVTVFFLTPGTTVTPGKWPCPRASEGVASCVRRFWSDSAARRRPGPVRREYPRDLDTFACRFYQRLAEGVGGREGPPGPLQIGLEEDLFEGRDDLVLEVESDDRLQQARFGKSEGTVIGRQRHFTLKDARPGVTYRGWLVGGQRRLEVFRSLALRRSGGTA